MRQPDYRTTAMKVHDCRARHSIGLDTAKRIVMRDELRERIVRCKDMDDVRLVLLEAFPPMEHADDY